MAPRAAGRLKMLRLGRVNVVSVVGEVEPEALAAALGAAADPAGGVRPVAVVLDLLTGAELAGSARGVLATCAGQLAGRAQTLLVANAPPRTARALAREAPRLLVHAREAPTAPPETEPAPSGKLPADTTGRSPSE